MLLNIFVAKIIAINYYFQYQNNNFGTNTFFLKHKQWFISIEYRLYRKLFIAENRWIGKKVAR